MKYYYNLNGTNVGPVTSEELFVLEQNGTININTPVIEEGGKQWQRWGNIRTTAALSALPSAPQHSIRLNTLFNKLINFNQGADALLNKIFRLPKFIPTDEAGQQARMRQLANITALAIWVSYIIAAVGLTAGCTKGVGPLIGSFIGAVIGGFIMQYVNYQIYVMTNALLIGNKITMASGALPRLLGLFSIIGVLVMLVCFCTANGISDAMVNLAGVFVLLMMGYMCFNAETFLIKVRPGEVSPGREFNNVIRLLLRTLFLAVQVTLPICCVLSAISLACSNSHSAAFLFNPAAVLLPLFAINLPIIIWLGLCLSSWVFDLYDSICSLSGIDAKLRDDKKNDAE